MSSQLKLRKRSELPDGCILNAPEQTVIITTNCEGAAGRGVALAMRERYRKVYEGYRHLCKSGRYTPNSLLYATVSDEQQLLLFPTKIKWRNASPPDLIIANLDKLASIYRELNIESLAIPPMGMANGWLKGEDKERVWNHMLYTFENMDIPCTIYTEE